jgi:hypothetical protein
MIISKEQRERETELYNINRQWKVNLIK